jgi:micrococcal nuclease
VLFLVLVAGAQGCGGTAPSGPAPAAGGSAVVRRVVDGDTVAVQVGHRTEHVRLLGIDTPESVKPNTPVQCFAKKASERTAALLPPGTGVRLVRDVEERDRYGRLLAYVYRVGDGLFVNLDLVRGGYARPLTIPPNVAHTDEIVQAARAAREGGKGLWAECPAASSLPP